MIQIKGSIINNDNLKKQYNPNSIERKIIDILISSKIIYKYTSLKQLNFEIDLRKNIINSAKKLYNSRFSFETFRKSKCNNKYWKRTHEGGFLLKDDATPSDAINDIFINGSKYATECATAIVIIFYKAVLNIYPKKLYNKMFKNIHLMNWHYIDKDLGVKYYEDEVDYLPGDCRYFKNPDVDPMTPEWQGENVIDLGDGTYYGHGIGIETADKIINILNSQREENATQSAYLIDSATRPNFKYLAKKYYDFISKHEIPRDRTFWRQKQNLTGLYRPIYVSY
ncbi:protein-glutamine gamma-glutamyltransferase [Caminicella sporogenes]|uniref:protein-glutamine gamma-glutamyltransferase n=1 Tax=Caminicella sporogenes TaxID=166485 RepID=UPI002540C6F9|nr:protein-glutamine gamma-glutamyltransferase [Caminicella sporogenes]WIF95641.1 protein-glutamine gamma-glutamyltransferase [Caminicella sporogenes]